MSLVKGYVFSFCCSWSGYLLNSKRCLENTRVGNIELLDASCEFYGGNVKFVHDVRVPYFRDQHFDNALVLIVFLDFAATQRSVYVALGNAVFLNSCICIVFLMIVGMYSLFSRAFLRHDDAPGGQVRDQGLDAALHLLNTRVVLCADVLDLLLNSYPYDVSSMLRSKALPFLKKYIKQYW